MVGQIVIRSVFFLCQYVVNFLDMIVSKLLNLDFSRVTLLLARKFLFNELLDIFDRVPADIPYRDARLFRFRSGVANKISSILFRQRWQRQSDGLAVVCRSQSQI